MIRVTNFKFNDEKLRNFYIFPEAICNIMLNPARHMPVRSDGNLWSRWWAGRPQLYPGELSTPHDVDPGQQVVPFLWE